MSVWAVYVMDVERAEAALGFRPLAGDLVGVAVGQPTPGTLLARGLSCTYFGEDLPDGSALEWCPTARSFVGRGGRRELVAAPSRERPPAPAEVETRAQVLPPRAWTGAPGAPRALPWWRRLLFWKGWR